MRHLVNSREQKLYYFKLWKPTPRTKETSLCHYQDVPDEQLTVSDLLAQPFTIHLLNNYTYLGLTNTVDHFSLNPSQARRLIRVEHHQLVQMLAREGIDYSQLGNALVPKANRHEIAFIFNSTAITSGMYGYSFAEKWIPILKTDGPEKTSVKVGDILALPSELVWRQFEERLVSTGDWPRLSREEYFVVYLTNLSPRQVANTHAALGRDERGYLGYVDCTTWNPLKGGMLLPQVGLRLGDTIITGMDDAGTANQVGYPFEESGFRIVGIPEEYYGPYLGFRLDNGVPPWADDDSAMALTVLGGSRIPASTSQVDIDEERIEYLMSNHGDSLRRAGLESLSAEAISDAIQRRLANGLIFNLRFRWGAKDGKEDRKLDAMMYSVQLEFHTATGDTKRFQVGLKYDYESHRSEVITFF